MKNNLFSKAISFFYIIVSIALFYLSIKKQNQAKKTNDKSMSMSTFIIGLFSLSFILLLPLKISPLAYPCF